MRCNESLEYWGAAYVAARWHEHETTFTGFIEDPLGQPKALGLAAAPAAPVGLACGYRPLLPRQWRGAQALWRCWKREAY